MTSSGCTTRTPTIYYGCSVYRTLLAVSIGTLHEIIGGIGSGSGSVEPIILAPASTRPSLGARLSALLGSPSAFASGAHAHVRLLPEQSRSPAASSSPSLAALGGGGGGGSGAGHSAARSSASSASLSQSLLASYLDPREGASPSPTTSGPTSGAASAAPSPAVNVGPPGPPELFVVLERLYPLLDAITQLFHVGGHKQLQFVRTIYNLFLFVLFINIAHIYVQVDIS